MSTFNPPADIAQITLAKSSDVNAVKAATAIAFGLLPSETKLQRGTVNFAVDTGTANSYVTTLDASITTYTDGLQVVFRPLNSNTGTSTLNLNGLGAKSIVLTNSDPIQAGHISAGAIIDVRYSTATGFFHLTPNSAIYAHDAGVYASDALASKNAAATSATNAAASATSASISASNAATSASSMVASVASCTASQSAAATSATNAATSATNAATSASSASTQASNASTSASAASTSATNAASSASTATTQASNASTSATNAANSATAAAASYDSFDDRYLGSKASDPTLDNDGNALLTGALYWNSSANVMKVYNGGAWSVAYVSASSTGASIRPSLLLDFANSKTLDPRITFTRASTATYTGADGLIKTAASGEARFDHNPTTGGSLGLLIEEARTNLLTYSEQFDNAAWAKLNTTITANATTAPDGTLTADKLVEVTANATHFCYGVSYSATNTTLTASFYVKPGGRTACRLQISNFLNHSAVVDCNLTTFVCANQTIGELDYSAVSGTVTDVGGGWRRCSITCVKGSVNSTNIASIEIQQSYGVSSYTGDGTSGIYIWGAQLEVGAFATSYIPSNDTFTSRASTGSFIGSNGLIQSAAANVARYNYNPLNLALSPKLLLEPAATNLLTYSEQFDNAAWTKSNATITANATTAPDGTVTADKLVEGTGTNTTSTLSNIQTLTNAIHTISCFAKAGERTQICLSYWDGVVNRGRYFDLSAGTVGGELGSSTTATITSVGNGWYLCAVTGSTASAAGTCIGSIRTAVSGSIYYTGYGTSGVYIWGAQLETGTSATSYIPTVASQVTRAADVSSSAQTTRAADNAVMTGTNFSSWYRQDEGTVFVKADCFSKATYPMLYGFTETTANINNQHCCFIQNGTTPVIDIWESGTSQSSLISSSITNGSTFLIADTYKQNSFASSLNGIAPVTDISGNIPLVITRMEIGTRNLGLGYSGHIAKLAYYPKRLTNAELQSITTV